MAYTVLTKETVNIELALLRAHAFIPETEDEVLLQMYLDAACEKFSEATGFVIAASEVQASFDSFDEVIRLYRKPITEIVSIKYYDVNSEEKEASLADVFVDKASCPARITQKRSWPSTDGRPGGVRVVFKAGFTDPDKIPQVVKWAALLMAATSYEFREDTVSGTIVTKVPNSSQSVIDMYAINEVL